MIRRLNLSPGPADFDHLVDPSDEGRQFPHWSLSFRSLYSDLTGQMQLVLGTTAPVMFVTTSGTGTLEALVTSALSPNDKVLVLSNGFFGDRLFRMAGALGLQAKKIEFDWSKPIGGPKLMQVIRTECEPTTRALLMVHLETSTGILNEVETVGHLLWNTEVLFILDAISSVGTSKVSMESWKVDGLACTSYKGLRSPPGLGIVAVSNKYLSRLRQHTWPSYSLNLAKIHEMSSEMMTATTAPTHSMLLLSRQIDKLLARGLENHYNDCKIQASRLRSTLIEAGLKVFGSEGWGNAITAVWIPPQLRNLNIAATMERNFGLYVGVGLGKLRSSTLRLAHYGLLDDVELAYVASCVKTVLSTATDGR